MHRPRRARPAGARLLLPAALLALAALAPGCASIEFTRDTQTSGRFVSKGWAFTFLSWDLPQSALDIARENASDSGYTNLQVTEASVWPYLGFFDDLLDILSVRRAKIEGTWGFDGGEAGGR